MIKNRQHGVVMSFQNNLLNKTDVKSTLMRHTDTRIKILSTSMAGRIISHFQKYFF